ncbi:ABC transporter permease [Deinococcus cavernae]|uniref:ABC transporter permease n=1 Tax=Deinococcus cavernae TaxID=2320857 RepID=A0A418VBR3_9DEIO|nr:ABC transporter permease [Deinococcus cavernae]RJF73459.1 ABC transporter permease [Deinococcus cavernae]
MTVATTQKQGVTPKAQTQWQVAWKQFRKNPLARAGLLGLALLYFMALFAPFLAQDSLNNYSTETLTPYHPPTAIHWRDPAGEVKGPFVYKYTQQLDMTTFENKYVATPEKCPVNFLARGDSYKLLGVIPMSTHLFGTGRSDCKVYLLGADNLGRDLYTRIMYAAQISLTIGIAAVFISYLIGAVMGSLAAYFGGWVDNLIMRIVEVLASIPDLFLIIMLVSIFPANVNPLLRLYIVLGVLAFINWGGVARLVRAQLLSVREQDYVMAANALGASTPRIMFQHMLPSMTTLFIVNLSIAIPGSILTESGLSFLGIGAVEPYASWGSLLNKAQEGGFSSFTSRPWVLIPGFFIVFTVMCWQLVGDGLRDAFDPRKRK